MSHYRKLRDLHERLDFLRLIYGECPADREAADSMEELAQAIERMMDELN